MSVNNLAVHLQWLLSNKVFDPCRQPQVLNENRSTATENHEMARLRTAPSPGKKPQLLAQTSDSKSSHFQPEHEPLRDSSNSNFQ